jgi:hypothetical protein
MRLSRRQEGVRRLAQAESESDIGRFGCLFDKVPEVPSLRNPWATIPAAILDDVHQPNEAALPTDIPVKQGPFSIFLFRWCSASRQISTSADVSASCDFR